MPASDDEVAAAVLSMLPCANATRLRELWVDHGTGAAALAAVQSGNARNEKWFPYARRVAWPKACDVDVMQRVLLHRGTRVLLPYDPDWPIPEELINPPALLFVEGSRFEALGRPTVGIVGTRAASPHGLADAYELAMLAVTAGLPVVSGLAIGIDAAAHRGAIDRDGLTIGVVATGLDITYPRRHVELFARVRDHGLIIGEYPFGVGPQGWRFPVRNRIIAALSTTCVVVEATTSGGALSTARHALELNRTILAMPGSRRNPAAAGTNALLRDGATMLLEPRDLFVATDRATAGSGQWTEPARPSVSHDAQLILRSLAGDSATLDQLLSSSGLGSGPASAALRELERVGRVERKQGKFWPR